MNHSTGAAAAAWRDIVPRWQRYGPPARPSAQDIARLRERMRRLLPPEGGPAPAAQVLVLGSTPEIRDMLARLEGVFVTLIDRVLPMMQAMTEMMTVDPPEEVWIRGDWLTAPLPAGYFDVVLSDLVLGNLAPDDQRRLIARVRDVLKPSGRWLCRADCVDEHSVIEDLSVLLEHWAGAGDDSAERLCALRSVAGLRYWDDQSGFLSYAALGEDVRRLQDGLGSSTDDPRAAVLRGLMDVILPLERPYWLWPKTRLNEELGRSFTVEHEEREDIGRAIPGRGYYVYNLAPRP